VVKVSANARSGATYASWSLGAMTVVWGATFVLVQDVVSVIPVSSFLWWRFSIAALVMVLLRPRSVLQMTWVDRRRGGIAGLLLGGGYALQTWGLQHTAASVSGFVTGMFVVFTPIMTGLLFRVRIPRNVWAGVVIAAVGLGVLSLHGASMGAGELVTLVAALSFSMQIAVLGHWSRAGIAYGLTVVQVSVAAIIGLALTAFDGGPALPPDAGTWLAIVFLGVVASALAYGVQTWAQVHISSSRAAVIMTSEPVWAGITGVAIAGDPLTGRLLVGGGLILLAMYVVELSPHRGPLTSV